ncbi:MAG: class I SAM-dependent methyltransferase [Oscillospiraceae bacterium]|nr:class I SAM-dependent methyltransferase [Oscillospiraceae bacterium]
MISRDVEAKAGTRDGPRLLLTPKTADTSRAEKLAEELGLELVFEQACTEGESVWLVLAENGLALTDGAMTVTADLTAMVPRLREDRLASELLVRAAGRSRQGEPPLAVDAAAGFGQDALLLAAAGYRVILFERNPIIAALLGDALERAEQEPALAGAASRMTLRREDSLPALARMEETPAVIYLDPMFPAKKKSGLTGKKFQLLHLLAGPCEQEEELLRAAWNARPGRIVVKRPLKGLPLAGLRPAWSLKGKTVRYDCLVPSEKRV